MAYEMPYIIWRDLQRMIATTITDSMQLHGILLQTYK